MMGELTIYSTLISRAQVQANIRTLTSGAGKWATLAESGQYGEGYLSGYLDALEQVAGSIEVDAGISAEARRLTVNR